MFNSTEVVINAFETELRDAYLGSYTNLEPSYPGIICYVGRMALELLANSDAPYHDMNHTISVTLLGQEVLKGRHLKEGGVSPKDWLHFVISLLCHDIGFVRGVCRNDRDDHYVINAEQETVTLPPGATDASLAPYHIERGKIFVAERFADNLQINVETICANIEYTQFPVPDTNMVVLGNDYPALVRAADLIGQLADPNYMRKITGLFMEFEETGMNAKLGYKSSADMRAAYPQFFWTTIRPYIADGLSYLRMTQQGKQWIANLYAHVLAEEHGLPSLGAERE